MKQKRGLALLALFLLLSSCSEVWDGGEVVLGNYAFQQGNFQKASLHYFNVLEAGKYKPWLLYNLGNVFYALGESSAALEIWGEISGEIYEDLQFRLYFNRGHLYFQRGLFQDAYLQFKNALKLHPRSLDTKRNLELTLLKIQALSSTLATANDRASPLQTSSSSSTMLEYVKQIESTRWKSNEKNDPEPVYQDW